MFEIAEKLNDRIYGNIKFKMIYRDKIDTGVAYWYHKTMNREFTDNQIKESIKVSCHWIIDMYIILFSDQLEGYKLHQCIDFLNSKDEGNLIIGMNMLYNLEIKS